ncbi:hypothetical protein Tco_0536712 [Tanacetum coccineum]
MTPPPGFSTLTPILGPNVNELPPTIISTFTAITPENTPLTHHSSTSANLDLMISPAFVEPVYEVLESALREQWKQIRNKEHHTELEYFSEEYDKEREMELRPIRIRETTPVLRTGVERNSKGRRPSEYRADDNKSQGVNLPPLLAAHLRRSENGQPLQSSLTSVHGGRQPSINIGGNLPPNGTAYWATPVRRIGSLGTAYWLFGIIYDVYTDVDTAYSSKSGNGLLIRQSLGYVV